MDTVKSLYEVLPEDMRLMKVISLVNVKDETIIIHSAKVLPSNVTPSVSMTVSLGTNPTQFILGASQEQIVNTVKYLIDKTLLPVRAMIVSAGKSYQIVDAPASNPTQH